MSNVIRYLKQKFHADEPPLSLDEYVHYADGNRVGYPADVVSVDYDHDNGLIVVGTRSGEVIVYGAGGATWHAKVQHKKEESVTLCKVIFFGRNIVLALCKFGIVAKLKIDVDTFSQCGSMSCDFSKDFKWDVMFVQKLANKNPSLLFGFNNKLIRIDSELETTTLVEQGHWQEWQPECTSIFDITCDPASPNTILMIIDGGRLVLFRERLIRDVAEMINADGAAVRKVVWNTAGTHLFAIGENHKYANWKVDFGPSDEICMKEVEIQKVDQTGPYPCNTLSHFLTLPDAKENKHEFVIYEGGKNRANYDDRTTVTVRQGSKVIVFEVMGEIITLKGAPGNYECKKKHGVLMIITSSEVIGIDLDSEDWKTMRPQHFFSVNTSAPTTQYRAMNIEETVWKQLMKASDAYWKEMNVSNRPWPLSYQKTSNIECNQDRAAYRQVHITGHATGVVYIWASGGLHMQVLLAVRTNAEFSAFIPPNKSGSLALEDGVEPGIPLAKIGDYDPFDDDENLAVNQIYLDPKKGDLIVANRGGYVFIYELYDTDAVLEPANPISFYWQRTHREHQFLNYRTEKRHYATGYQPMHKEGETKGKVLHFYPNIEVTALLYISSLNCLVIGGAFGYAFIDTKAGEQVWHVPLHIQEGADVLVDNAKPLSRYKSMKQSIRKTFRLRKRNRHADGTRTAENSVVSSPSKKDDDASTSHSSSVARRLTAPQNDSQAASHSSPSKSQVKSDDEEADLTQVERLIEARTDLPDAEPTWIVKCMRLMRLPLLNKNSMDDVIAIGTSGGKVFFYKINESRNDSNVAFEVYRADTLKLTRPQPIVNIGLSTEDGIFSAATTRLVVFTDEQIRLFSYPGKATIAKYKIMSMEGLRIKKASVVKLPSRDDAAMSEMCALIVTNQGDIRVHSLRHPNIFHQCSAINSTDIAGISSAYLTTDGELTWLRRWSEIQRNTVAAHYRGWSNLRSKNALSLKN